MQVATLSNRKLVLLWVVRSEMQVAICVHRFLVIGSGDCVILLATNVNIQKWQSTVFFHFICEFYDRGRNPIQMIMKLLNKRAFQDAKSIIDIVDPQTGSSVKSVHSSLLNIFHHGIR